MAILAIGLVCASGVFAEGFNFRVERLGKNPIVRRDMPGLEGKPGENINGPSLIRVPEWVENPLGKYYLYFAHHHGKYIRLAYADSLEGPWKIHKPGVLAVEATPGFGDRAYDHVASPDVHVDHAKKRILMYYHGMSRPGTDEKRQMTYLALSRDGLRFDIRPDTLGTFYFRVFEHKGWHYALAKHGDDGAVWYRSRDGLSKFEEGSRILPLVRHTAVWKHDGRLYVFYSRGGDEPEHIMVSRIENLDDDWRRWKLSEPQSVLKPEREWEGAKEPVLPSKFGATYDFVHQLRDPAIYEEGGKVYLLYSAAGERSIGIARIHLKE